MLQFINGWQRGFPLTPRPFADIGEKSGLAEDEVISRFLALREQGVIDRIGPVFRPNTVGASSLAAIAVPPGRLEAVGALVSAQPGVNHNYERSHRYNLWFVVTGAAEADVQKTLARIERATGLEVLRLPLLEEFHIDLGFDLDTHAAPRTAAPQSVPELSPDEQELVAAVAHGLAFVPAPYRKLAQELDLTEAKVISLLEKMLADGRIRRIGAVIRHRRLGYKANAMVVWDVPDELAGALGRRLAADPAVTLCYRRARALPQWPYNLYCMVHGRERGPVLQDIERLTASCARGFPRAMLFSKRCFAQRAARYG